MNILCLLVFVLLCHFAYSIDLFDFLNDIGGESNGGANRRRGDNSDNNDSSTTKINPLHDCKGYVCPGSNQCVDIPLECPCPYGTIKYYVNDWYACIQYNQIKNGEFSVKVV